MAALYYSVGWICYLSIFLNRFIVFFSIKNPVLDMFMHKPLEYLNVFLIYILKEKLFHLKSILTVKISVLLLHASAKRLFVVDSSASNIGEDHF